ENWASAAALLYLVSLALPAVVVPPLFRGPDQIVAGAHCLLLGWLTLPWYANPVLAFAAIALAYDCRALAACLGLAAFGLGLTTLMFPDIRYVHAGYFTWLGSMLALVIASRYKRGH